MDRIELLASLTKGYNTLADIGCDHGYTSIKAVKTYQVNKVYACDINILPLENAKQNIEKNNLLNKINTVLSNGLENLDVICEVVLISGMGGILISQILNDSISKVRQAKRLILQANSEKYELRQYLVKNNFVITNEYAIYDKNKYYEIIVCNYEENYNYSLTNKELLYGPILLKEKNENFRVHYKRIYNDLTKNLKRVKDEEVALSLKNRIEILKDILLIIN